ncbi:hypothetical protein HO133_000788 [Letharia lupina]|uniref:Uncharacterized protein n=1 Tax=Letharia lupina TaxID=560253 RepID=A0A8H6FBY0_9LECA|nr:uncharacterized protein HO133_000788 [Letharia lupina]KAF6222740.1 hypothetical protein HO133_000788 [Letharia lupina]
MSLKKLNKVTFLEPERQTTEEHQGPSKSLKETLEVVQTIKTALRDVEHHVDQTAASEAGVKRQLEEQVMKTKQEVVRLERMLAEELEAAPDVFEAEEGG